MKIQLHHGLRAEERVPKIVKTFNYVTGSLSSSCPKSLRPCISFISDLKVIVLKPEALLILLQSNWTSNCNPGVSVDLDMQDAPPEGKNASDGI